MPEIPPAGGADSPAAAAFRLPWEPAAVALAVLVIWEGGGQALGVPPYLLPRPLDILSAMYAQGGRMAYHLGLTLGEALAGFAGGVFLGVLVAFGLASSAFLRRELQPLIVFSQSMPTAALAPLLVVWFGLGLLPKALLALVLVFFPITVNVTSGLLHVDPDLLRLVRSYRATAWQAFVKVRLPHALGYLIAGMKIAAPLALIGAVVGEFVGANRGIGFVILDAAARLATVEMLAGITYVGLTGTALFLAVEVLERRLAPRLGDRR
jgi:NitT/TauT family transport system permease protein